MENNSSEEPPAVQGHRPTRWKWILAGCIVVILVGVAAWWMCRSQEGWYRVVDIKGTPPWPRGYLERPPTAGTSEWQNAYYYYYVGSCRTYSETTKYFQGVPEFHYVCHREEGQWHGTMYLWQDGEWVMGSSDPVPTFGR